MTISGEGTRERRWIILSEDGRHVTVGRHTDPAEDELKRAAAALSSTGQGGWLVVTEGRYYSSDHLTLMMVRELSPTHARWDVAVEAFQAARSIALDPGRNKPTGLL